MITRTASALSVLAVGLLLAIAAPAQAVLLDKGFVGEPFLDTFLSGTTSAARPELAGTVLEDVITPFSFGALNISGTVQNRVVRETVSGTLDFYWRIKVDPTSTGGDVEAFRLGNFGYDNIVDADWRIDGLGASPAYTGRVLNPLGRPDGAINFLFPDPAVRPGDPAADDTGSYFFFLHTDATEYAKIATYDLLGGSNQTLSDSFQTFAPVPEPSSFLLMALGLGVAGFAVRRHRT